jgi:hypothetical protein
VGKDKLWLAGQRCRREGIRSDLALEEAQAQRCDIVKRKLLGLEPIGGCNSTSCRTVVIKRGQ